MDKYEFTDSQTRNLSTGKSGTFLVVARTVNTPIFVINPAQ